MSVRRALRVGLIADTHGELRPGAVEALRGVDHIVHAGDVGRAEVLDRLGRIAPVTAVRGNVDRGAWADRLPATAEIELGGARFHVLHALDDLDLDPGAAGFDVVVHGHTHRPECRRAGAVLFVNPGSAGPRRFRLPVSLAVAEVGPQGVEVSFVRLATG
jgi:hypothetical protein